MLNNPDNPADQEIMKWLSKLDDVAAGYEADWGIGRLPMLVPPETAAKWDRQMQRLNDAIDKHDLPMIREVVPGCIRGWAALDAQARQAGHAPCAPDAWEVKHPDSGNVYRITKNLNDARAENRKGVSTWTLEEVARVLENNSIVAEIKKEIPGARLTDISAINWKGGDGVPF